MSNIFDDEIKSKVNIAINNIFGFEIVREGESERVQAPRMNLPEAVKKRIDFFGKYAEDGLSFLGCLRYIMAVEDEEELKKDFEYGAYEDYLPASQEFIEWRDEIGTHRLRDMEVAVALIYGFGGGDDD